MPMPWPPSRGRWPPWAAEEQTLIQNKTAASHEAAVFMLSKGILIGTRAGGHSANMAATSLSRSMILTSFSPWLRLA